MIRYYSNPRIYKNFKVVKVLSIIAIVFALIGLITDLILIINLRSDIDIDKFLSYHLMSLVIPFSLFYISREPYKQSTNQETEGHNDFSILLVEIILSLLPLILYIVLTLLGSSELIYLPNIFIYISDVFLIYNCVLIKREWKENPPQFLKPKYEARARRQSEKTKANYISLIEKCGIKFFIKYYKQVKMLPLRDVEVENYSFDETQIRLQAVKKIIDMNLVEQTLLHILISYNGILDGEYIEKATALLSEVQSENGNRYSESQRSYYSDNRNE